MNRLFEDSGRVLAFGAHPDDMEVGAGGLLARLVEEGATVTMAVISIPSDMETRRLEAADAAAAIGAQLRFVFDERPSRVEDIPMHELVRRMDQLVADTRPDLVITHCGNDIHWDHCLVHRATVSALRRTPCDVLTFISSPEMNAQVRGYGNCFADITKTIDTKIRAINAHQSQLQHLDVESSRDLARAMGRLSGHAFAEAFEVLRVRI
jgi:LmbE family N-acetylglucosaminyl deacetylase